MLSVDICHNLLSICGPFPNYYKAGSNCDARVLLLYSTTPAYTHTFTHTGKLVQRNVFMEYILIYLRDLTCQPYVWVGVLLNFFSHRVPSYQSLKFSTTTTTRKNRLNSVCGAWWKVAFQQNLTLFVLIISEKTLYEDGRRPDVERPHHDNPTDAFKWR